MSLRLLSFLVVSLVYSSAQAAPALAGHGGWRPQLHLSVALPLPGPVAYAPPSAPPAPMVHLHAAAPPMAYAAPPPPRPAQQWVWVKGSFVVLACGTRAWEPAHWELRTVAPVHYAYGHGQRHRDGPHYGHHRYRHHQKHYQKHYDDGPSYAHADEPHQGRRWQR